MNEMIERRIKLRYPNFRDCEVRKRMNEYAQADTALKEHIATLQPRMHHSPEFLNVDRLATPLQKHTYQDIANYAWALKDLDGFAEVRKVCEQYGLVMDMFAPVDYEEYISPVIFYGYLWWCFRQKDIDRYSSLKDLHMKITRRSYQISDDQYMALKARGIIPHVSQFEVYFEAREVNDFVEQYRQKGYVAIPTYVRSTAEVIEREIQKINPDACLGFDRRVGVVIC